MYKIGSYIKIKSKYEHSVEWYHTNMMKIIDYYNNENYFVNFENKFGDRMKSVIIGNDRIYQDEECINFERKQKFKRILKDYNEI